MGKVLEAALFRYLGNTQVCFPQEMFGLLDPGDIDVLTEAKTSDFFKDAA